MHYLIDGHNLIAKLPDISLEDADDEARLVLRLKSWAAAGRNRRVTVIFDGGLPGGEAHHLSSGPVKVIFASSGRKADALIIDRIQKVPNPAEYILVSSDREVRAAAGERRMTTLKAKEFASQLQSQLRPKKASLDTIPARDQLELSDDEVAEWLEIFRPNDEI